MSDITLRLPLPPSQNRNGGQHLKAKHHMKRRYQTSCWIEAVKQCTPRHAPASPVRIQAHFQVWNIRDEDNLAQSLKWPLDALKLIQRGSLRWRQGLYERQGYFIDDSPNRCRLEKPTQEIARGDECLILTISAIEEAE